MSKIAVKDLSLAVGTLELDLPMPFPPSELQSFGAGRFDFAALLERLLPIFLPMILDALKPKDSPTPAVKRTRKRRK